MESIDAAALLEIATENVAESSMRFDPVSGMYYDSERDLYYDIHNAIYYDYKTGIYYKMDDVENLVEVFRTPNFQIENKFKESELEEGEIIDEIVEEKQIGSEPVSYDPSEKQLGGRAGAIRAIVTKCRLSTGLDIGSLIFITINGCTIGSADSNDLQIKSEDVDSFHCWITYSSTRGYFLTTNGPLQILKHSSYDEYSTLLETGTEILIEHECSLEIGYTILELHLHPPSTLGQSETCDGCEPGVRKAAILRQSRLAMPSRDEIRKDAHKNLKKVCGVTTNRQDVKAAKKVQAPSNYRDRAAERREKVGVDAPYSNEKPANVNTEIPKTNIGRKMMEKAGWKSGEGLGKTKQGIIAPIAETSTRMPKDQTGIGSAKQQKFNYDKKAEMKKNILLKTAERYYSDNQP